MCINDWPIRCGERDSCENCKNLETKKEGSVESAGAAAAGLSRRVNSSRTSPTRKKVGVLLYTLGHLDGNGVHQVLKGVLDVDPVFGARLKELEAEALGELATLLHRDPPGVQVTLVPHQHSPGILPGQVLDGGSPARREGGREGEREGGREQEREGRGEILSNIVGRPGGNCIL